MVIPLTTVAAPPSSPVTDYAHRAIAGEYVVGRLVRLACERHLRDLETGESRGLWFDEKAAAQAIGFFGYLHHSLGEWAGQPFVLAPWQEFIVGSIFGWRRGALRRFRTAYVSVARKNGKTAMSAGIGLIGLVADHEPGAHIYSAATTRDQAKLVFGEAERMVERSPKLARVKRFVNNLHVTETAAKFQPLSADASTMDGLNVHMALVDEVHEHPNGDVIAKLKTGMGARRQPLLFEITTAGWDRNSICYVHNDFSIKVLEGIIEDDEWFGYIATIDETDDYRDPACWPKANPNLGVCVKPDDLERQVREAQDMPAEQNVIRRLRLNQWTEQSERWLDMAVWDACSEPVNYAAFIGRPCYAGLDLSTTWDITALVLVFPERDGSYAVLPFFWVPKDNLQTRVRKDRVPYDVWLRDDYLKATEGNVVDYDVIRADINELGKLYDIRELAIDRWNSTQLQTQLLGDGFVVVPFGQGFASMTAPTKEVERLLRDGALRHGGNPVLRWMASNVAVRQDAAGNLKPDKEKSADKIDGVVALCMAIGRAIVDTTTDSVYQERGVLTL